MSSEYPNVLLAADWGIEPHKRAAYKANVAQRRIERVEESEWNLPRLLEAARREVEAGHGPVLLSVDLVIGVPAAYFQAVQSAPQWSNVANFIDWLPALPDDPAFWKTTEQGIDWSIEHPFFSAPRGKGSLKALYEEIGYELLRHVDIKCRSNSPFMVSGIPGTVGSGTRAFWQELAEEIGGERDFKIWPFEGPLAELFDQHDIIVAENYPGITYTAAIAANLPSRKIYVSKTDADVRREALELLEQAKWIAEASVKLPDLQPAESSEDEFDALMAAAGQLRCVLAEHSLEDPSLDDPVAEGGILLTSVVDFTQNGTKFKPSTITEHKSKTRKSGKPKSTPKDRKCPIPGCTKVFRKTRSGWDAHVGSLVTHKEWHPEITDPELRRQKFEEEFPEFFE